MGHRALLAYRRDDISCRNDTDHRDDTDSSDSADAGTDTEPNSDPTFDLHRSHWGGASFGLARRISAETPFASDTSFGVTPDPVATDLSLAEIVAERLDFLHHEAFFRVGDDYETTPFHVLWFGLETDSDRVERSETVGHGALLEARPWGVEPQPNAGDDYLRGWFRGTKAAVGEMVDHGAVTPEEATDYLSARVESWGDDREVILPE
ncbi:DUF6735 family protein [Halorussus amylolyticus]|uniref:DUF6735 family protein n=1 Tax=Halorussus amylolyticus TaxID=1126242 RepID=UPI001046FDB0|nr:DUF6735 family protein [Halorussus amylolyticus]